MRQQLSPMFRLSRALLEAGPDPARAADALDAATGRSASGFEQLAMRPASRGGTAATPPPVLLVGGGGGSGDAQQEQQRAAPPVAAAARWQYEQMQEERPQLESTGTSTGTVWRAAPPPHAAFPSAGSMEVDSLVVNARAAAGRAQSAIAALASPPRQAQLGGATPTSRPVPRPGVPAPYAQQQQPPCEAGSGQLAAAGLPADAEAVVAHLRQHSETLIRSVGCSIGRVICAMRGCELCRSVCMPAPLLRSIQCRHSVPLAGLNASAW